MCIRDRSGSIKGDGSAVTLTLGGSNTTLNLENPNINGSLSIGSTTINNKLTFTTNNGYILFDYEPSGDTAEYTTEVPLLKVGIGTGETTILARVSEYRGVVLGADDTVWLQAGDTKSVIKTNVNLTAEQVLLSAEGGFHAYGFPGNDTSWSNRVEFKFRTDSTTASENGLYIGDGSYNQFIDLNRNITAASVNSFGHIKAVGGGNVYVYDDSDNTKIHFHATSNDTEGVLKVNNGANYGFVARGVSNHPRIGTFHTGSLNVYGFGNSMGADDSNDDLLAKFDFDNERFDVNGEIRGDSLDIDGNADIAGNLVVDGGNITIDADSAGASLTWKESDSTAIAGQLRGYSNRGDIYLYQDGVKKTELSPSTDSFIPKLHIGATSGASGGVLQTTGDVNIDGNACLLYTSPSPRDGLLSRMPSSA